MVAENDMYSTDFKKTVASLRRMIELYPYNATHHYKLACVFSKKVEECKNNDEKEIYLRSAELSYLATIKINSEHKNAHYNLAVTLKKQGRLDDAKKEFREVISIDPNDAEAHNALGIIFYKKYVFEEAGVSRSAEAEFREALKINPNYVDAHVHLSITLIRQTNFIDAEKELQEAVNIDPNILMHHNLEFIMKTLSDVNKIKKECKNIIDVDPFEDAHLSPYMINEYEKAKIELNEAIQIDPDDALLHFNLGMVLCGLRWFIASGMEYNKAIKLGISKGNDDAKFHYALGDLHYFHHQNYHSAVNEYNEAIRIDNNNAIYYYALGRVNWDLMLSRRNYGQYDQAKMYYEKAKDAYKMAVEIDPNNKKYLDALNCLL